MERIVPKKVEKCIICNQIITPDDIRYNNYEIVVNKRDRERKYFHANCFRNLTKMSNNVV